MSNSDNKKRSTLKKKESLYSEMLINKVVPLPMQNIGSNLLSNIKTYIENEIAGKCIKEGYIKPDSIKIINYSNGVLQDNLIVFQVVIQCEVCYPVEGQILNCFAKNITKAGIKAEIRDDDNNPLVIFVARDHNYLSKNFSNIKENENLEVRVIGQRFELNDTQISVIGTLVEGKSSKSKLTIKEDIEINIDN